MMRKTLLVVAALAAALPANARGLRFTCLLTGKQDQSACCCTGSTTEACGGGVHEVRPAPSCGS
jgi:hypothetical protein